MTDIFGGITGTLTSNVKVYRFQKIETAKQVKLSRTLTEFRQNLETNSDWAPSAKDREAVARLIEGDEETTQAGQVLAQSASELIKRLERRLEATKVTAESLLEHGLKWKGQLCYAFTSAAPASLTVNLSFSPPAVTGFIMGVSTTFESNIGKQRSVVIHRGATHACSSTSAPKDRIVVTRPLAINSLVGRSWKLRLSAAAMFGVGWKVESKLAITDPSRDPAAQEKEDTETDNKSEDREIELAAIEFEASAGVEANANLMYESFYAEDPLPLFYSNAQYEFLLRDLSMVLEEGSTKTMLKAQAVDLMNANRDNGVSGLHPQLSIGSLWSRTFTLSTETVLARLKGYMADCDAASLPDARDLAQKLERFACPKSGEIKKAAYDFIRANPGQFQQVDPGWITKLRHDKPEEHIGHATLAGSLKKGTDLLPEQSEQRAELLAAINRIYAEQNIKDALDLIKDHKAKGCCCSGTPPSKPVYDDVVSYLSSANAQGKPNPGGWVGPVCDDISKLLNSLTGAKSTYEVPTFLLVTSSEAGGQAEVFTRGKATVSVPVVAKASLGAGLKAELQGSRKWSHSMFQTGFLGARVGETKETAILTTYDTHITYKSVSYKVDASATAKGQIQGSKENKAKASLFEREGTYNSMRYITSVVAWTKPDGNSNWCSAMLQGTGLVFGVSISIENLRGLFGWVCSDLREDDESTRYLMMLKQQLSLDRIDDAADRLEDFLTATDTQLALWFDAWEKKGKLKEKEKRSFYLEASYRVTELFPVEYQTKEAESRSGRRLVTLNPTMFKTLARKPRELNFLRLRCRMHEMEENREDLFTLGFAGKFDNSIRLERIERAGQDAFVELATGYVDEQGVMRILAVPDVSDPSDDPSPYEYSVPSAPLFCQ